MHKYYGIKRATYINEKAEKHKFNFFGALCRVILSCVLVGFVFLGENSGINQIKELSEWTKDAVCYDVTETESYSYVQKLFFGESEKA